MNVPLPFWSLAAGDLLARLGTTAQGLSSDAARDRLAQYGSNRLTPKRRTDALTLLLAQFESPIVLILVFAALLSLFARDSADALIILAIILASAGLGYRQIDGGLVNPLPVDVTRQLGAQFVIAVSVLGPSAGAPDSREAHNVAAQLLARFHERIDRGKATRALVKSSAGRQVRREEKEGPGLFDVLSKASAIVQARIAAAQLREHPADHLIEIALPDVGVFDFHRAAELVAAGRAATRQALPEIRAKLARSMPLYRRVRRWLDTAARPR
jgi:Cation transporter/ATPase, N-terminus